MTLRILQDAGPVVWVLLGAAALALAVFGERLLHYRREQIQTAEFLSGVRNVLKRDNVVEALSICDATPGPVARLVRVALVHRERGRERVERALQDAGAIEAARLEERLPLLATLAQITPVLGLLGSVLGAMAMFQGLHTAGVYAHPGDLARGLWQALASTAVGLAVSIPCYAGYNLLLCRAHGIVLDMETAANEIAHLVTEK